MKSRTWNLGWNCYRADRLADAEAGLTRAIRISLSKLGPDHALSGDLLAMYAEFLRKTGRKTEAKPFAKRASAIRAKSDHPGRYAVDITDLARR